MKVPKEINTYCPRCRAHTPHTVSIYKKGKDRVLAEGARRYQMKQKGYGGQKKPIQRRTAKVTKKQTLKLRCKECGYIIHREGIRLRKLEVVS